MNACLQLSANGQGMYVFGIMVLSLEPEPTRHDLDALILFRRKTTQRFSRYTKVGGNQRFRNPLKQ
jgi:hypothetical protein